MKKIEHCDFDLHRIGNDLQYGGLVLTNGQETLIVPVPEEQVNILTNPVNVLVGDDAFESVIRQTDVVETKIFDHNKKTFVLVRKSQRQLDQAIIWKVFRRDNFTCRYCGNDNVQMTYDHVMLWEKGGPCTELNGITACKKCNKTRGNMEYQDWLESEYYLRVSENVTEEVKNRNKEVVSYLKQGLIQPRVGGAKKR